MFYLPFETVIGKYLPEKITLLMRYSIEPISITLLFYLLCTKLLKRQICLRGYKSVLIPLILFTLISIISSIFNLVSIDIFTLGLRWFLRYIPIFLIIVLLDWEIEEIKRIIFLNFSILFLENIIAILQLVLGERINIFLEPETISISDTIIKEISQGESEFAVYATFGRYSSFALFLSIWFMFIFSRSILLKKSNLLLVLSGFILMMTYARQAALGVLIGILVVALIHNNKKLKLMVLISVSALLVSYYVFLQNTFGFVPNDISQGIYQRFFGAFTYENFIFDIENGGRLYFLTDVANIFLREAPILGFGMGMYGTEAAISLNQYVYTYYGIPTTFSMDVFWVSVLGQVGILGLFCWLSIYIILFVKALHLFKNTSEIFAKWFSLGYLATIPVIIIESFFSSNLNDRHQSFYFWLLSGLFLVLYKKYFMNMSR